MKAHTARQAAGLRMERPLSVAAQWTAGDGVICHSHLSARAKDRAKAERRFSRRIERQWEQQ